MKEISIITANMGNFEKAVDPVPQSVPIDFFRFTDENFPPRTKAVTPRLQARIVKIFGWQMVPGYNYYIWVDSSCYLPHPDSARWLMEQLGDADIAVFQHPQRKTIQEEADYLKLRLSIKCPYITPRYENELIDEQLAEIYSDKDFVDQNLYASTALIYKNTPQVQEMMKEWWYHTSRFHSIDQLSLPYVLTKSGCKVSVIHEKYNQTPYLTYVRK